MRTAEMVERAGVYQNACCGTKLTLYAGQIMPPCPKCGHDCSWSMIRPVMSA